MARIRGRVRHLQGAAAPARRLQLRPLRQHHALVTLGYAVPGDRETVAQRFTHALGSGDERLLHDLYDPDVGLYTPLGWPIKGLPSVKEFIGQFHAGYPGLRVTLHDEYGQTPTDERGTMSETHAAR